MANKQEGTAIRSRHWAIAGLTALGALSIVYGYPQEFVATIVTAIGGMFVWDKLEKYSKAGATH